ncbi:MAG: DUF3857 domain-containing protein [Chitinophagaceae bacterium]
MKPLSLVFLLSMVFNALQAQKKDLPSFGKVSEEELKMTECPFEKDAEAMYLYDAAWVSYIPASDIPFVTESEYVVRIKIFNEKGFDHATVKIPFYDERKYEQIDRLSAYTYNLGPDGKVLRTEVDKKLFFREKTNNSVTTISFTFPELKAGSIVEYRYKRTRKSYSRIDPWYFQTRLPVGISHYNQVVPEYFNFTKQIRAGLPLDKKEEKVRDNYENTYTMRNIPSLRSEPYMAAPKDYLQRVEFQLASIQVPMQPIIPVLSTWEKLCSELMADENFGVQLRKNIKVPQEMAEQLKSIKSSTEKLRILHDYVRNNFEWNGVEDIYTDGVKNVMAKKTGSNADLNLLLLNLLRDQDLEAYPILVSTRDHGKVFRAYPFVSQFNKVILLCKGDNDYFVVNAADKYNPLHLIPYDVMGTDAFIVDNKSSGFVTLWNPDQKKTSIIYFNGEVKGDSLTGSATINSNGYARNTIVKKYQESAGTAAAMYASNGDYKVKIDSFVVENLKADTLPLLQRFNYKLPVNKSGEYNFFTVNLFTGLEKNPFTSERRFTDVDFGFNQSYVVSGTIRLPADAAIEELPKNISMIMPDTSIVFRRVFQVTENVVQFRINIEFRSPVYAVQDYDNFKEFYKQLFSLLTEQVVFRRKENS